MRGNLIRKKLSESGFYAKYTFGNILYHCQEMKRLVEMAQLYSHTASNIMIEGETGTGKELFAQSIHNAGKLSNGPFVAVNCAALPGNLLESELFGYAPGAFTGASRALARSACLNWPMKAHCSLMNLTEMDVFLQAKLLRALQTGEIMRIGDNKVHSDQGAHHRRHQQESAAGHPGRAAASGPVLSPQCAGPDHSALARTQGGSGASVQPVSGESLQDAVHSRSAPVGKAAAGIAAT